MVPGQDPSPQAPIIVSNRWRQSKGVGPKGHCDWTRQTFRSGSNAEPRQSDGMVGFGCVVCAVGKDAKVLPIHCVAVPTDEEYIWPMTIVMFLALRESNGFENQLCPSHWTRVFLIGDWQTCLFVLVYLLLLLLLLGRVDWLLLSC